MDVNTSRTYQELLPFRKSRAHWSQQLSGKLRWMRRTLAALPKLCAGKAQGDAASVDDCHDLWTESSGAFVL